MINGTLIVQITSNRTCAMTSCLNLFQSQINQVLTKTNDNSVIVPYRQENSTEIEWISYQLPKKIQSSEKKKKIIMKSYSSQNSFCLGVSSVAVDPTVVASQLEKLLVLDRTRTQLWQQSFSRTTVFIDG